MKKLSIILELLAFMRESKKWWLVPIITLLILFGSLVILAEGSALAPFIYAVF